MWAQQEPDPEPATVSVGTQTEALPVEFTLDIRNVRLYAPHRVYIIWRMGASYTWSGVHFGAAGWEGSCRLLEGNAYLAGRDILGQQAGEPREDLLAAAVRTYSTERQRHGAPSRCRIYFWAS
eukprot:4408304-Amphidinium_carterae.3